MTQHTDVSSILAKVPLFRGLDAAQRERFAARCRLRQLPAGALVFRRGAPGDALYVVASGQVRVFVDRPDGRELTLVVERVGGCFGELSLLDGAVRSASVATLVPTGLLVMSRRDFLGCLRASPEIGGALLAALAARVRRLTDQAGSLALDDVRHRLLAVLFRLAEHRDGAWVVERRPSQQALADMIGTTRESVGRHMRALAEAGLLTRHGRGIRLHDAAVGPS